jgi:hypothetical protein
MGWALTTHSFRMRRRFACDRHRIVRRNRVAILRLSRWVWTSGRRRPSHGLRLGLRLKWATPFGSPSETALGVLPHAFTSALMRFPASHEALPTFPHSVEVTGWLRDEWNVTPPSRPLPVKPMIDIKTDFAIRWLTLRCIAQRSDAEFSTDAILQRAQDSLELCRATTEVDRTAGAMRFGRTWKAGRPWVSWIARGNVRVVASGKPTVVEVRGSLLPLVGIGAVFAGFLGVAGGGTFGEAVCVCVFGLNAWRVYRGLRSVASDAVRL